MSRYLFIQSQDPFTEVRTQAQFDLARRLADAGSSVTLLLVQNAVVAARLHAQCPQFDSLLGSKVEILADSFALRQREIDDDQLKSNIRPTEISLAVDAMLNGDKVIWN